jgi:hypothetical protein
MFPPVNPEGTSFFPLWKQRNNDTVRRLIMFTGQSRHDLVAMEYTGGIMTGWVVKTQKELEEDNMVGFFIPRILGLIPGKDGPVETDAPLKTGIFANAPKYKVPAASTVKVINYLKVKYNGRSNFSQPVIALGESAHIFFVDGDYKKPRYTDDNNNEVKRKTDVITLYCFGKQDVDTDPGDAYKITINTIDKKIFIHTSQNNGETHMYDHIIDTENGSVVTKDETGNEYGFETDAKHVYMKNADESIVELTEKNIHGKCDEKISWECTDFEITASNSMVVEATNKYELHSTKITETGDATVDIITATMTCDVSSLFKCTSPMSLFSGMLGAPQIGTSAAAQSPPNIQITDVSGATLTHSPRGVGAWGDRVLACITAMIPFLLIPPVSGSVIPPIAAMIPNPLVKH